MFDSSSERFDTLNPIDSSLPLPGLYSESPSVGYGLNPSSLESAADSGALFVEDLDMGIFTVGDIGEVTFDYLLDGGRFEGELAIFNVEGMNRYDIDSKIFLQEAALRALQNSAKWGYIVMSDGSENAKFSKEMGDESSRAQAKYLGSKTFEMDAGSKFGVMLIPDTTVEDAFKSPDLNGKNRPLFSFAAANPNGENQLAQLVETNPSPFQQIDGNSFGMEDMRLDAGSDRDYDDVLFQIRGAAGNAPLIGELIDPERGWRDTLTGERLIDYAALNGKGLSAEYFDTIDFISSRGRRTDATINNDWGLEAPEVMTSADTFSVRWTGEIEPLYSEDYTFYTLSDDRVRLYVDGELLIDNFTDRPLTEDSASITLEAQRRYDIKIEYAENADEAAMKLLWSSTSQPKEVIPQNVLYPDAEALPIELETGLEYVPNELLVKFDVGLSDSEIQEIARSNGTIELEKLVPLRASQPPSELDQWRVLYFPDDTELRRVRETLSKNESVISADLDYILEDDVIPNDPFFNSPGDELWGLKKIDAPKAWDLQKGSRDIVVAVVDTGVDYTHPDLIDNMWRNPGEADIANGIDDDGNGYVDDIFGYDFGDKDGIPFDPLEGNGHGTRVAGTIGAIFDNNQGVVGVSPEVSIMALKRKSSGGLIKSNLKYAVRAIDYAVFEGADIINTSWGVRINAWTKLGGFFGITPSFGSANDAIRRANDAEVLLVASAGNDAENIDNTGRFPSTLDLPNVITVAATNINDELASFSNYGAANVDIGAPGTGSDPVNEGLSVSTFPGGGYKGWNGTSMAAPYVAGAAALLLAEDPFLRASELRNILMSSADPAPALSGKTVIGGRLNVHNALLELNPVRRLRLVINELEDIGLQDEAFLGVGASPADFYARVNIGGQQFDNTQNIGNESNPTPDWTFIKPIDVSTASIDLSINIRDSDSGFRGSDHDADVSPSPDSNALSLTYDIGSGDVIDRDTGIRYSVGSDGRFYFAGDNEDDRADIWFTIDLSA